MIFHEKTSFRGKHNCSLVFVCFGSLYEKVREKRKNRKEHGWMDGRKEIRKKVWRSFLWDAKMFSILGSIFTMWKTIFHPLKTKRRKKGQPPLWENVFHPIKHLLISWKAYGWILHFILPCTGFHPIHCNTKPIETYTKNDGSINILGQ